jgi:hypothetical protein
MESVDKGSMPYSPIQTNLDTFVANCRNLMGTCDGSDKFVSTPGAPNIRIVPSVVPVESDIMTSIRPNKIWRLLTDGKNTRHWVKSKGVGIQDAVKCPKRPDFPVLPVAQVGREFRETLANALEHRVFRSHDTCVVSENVRRVPTNN